MEYGHPSTITDMAVKVYKEVDIKDYKEIASVSTWAQNASSSDKARCES